MRLTSYPHVTDTVIKKESVLCKSSASNSLIYRQEDARAFLAKTSSPDKSRSHTLVLAISMVDVFLTTS